MRYNTLGRTVPSWLLVLVAMVLATAALAISLGSVPWNSTTPAPSNVQNSGSPPGPALLTEQQAHAAVWALPEVQASSRELEQRGAKPTTMTASRPDPADASPARAGYLIQFAEDHGNYVVPVETFLVDARTGQVVVFDPTTRSFKSLEEWRAAGGTFGLLPIFPLLG